jgi:hypothetical protein
MGIRAVRVATLLSLLNGVSIPDNKSARRAHLIPMLSWWCSKHPATPGSIGKAAVANRKAGCDSVDVPGALKRLVHGSDAYIPIRDVLTKRLAALQRAERSAEIPMTVK